MADTTITRPEAGQQIVLEQVPGNRLLFDFPTDQALLDRVDDNLVLTFDDGGTVTLQNFYTAYTKDTLPEFVIDGQPVAGEQFFAALGEDLMPAAGPAAAAVVPGAGSGAAFGDVSFLGGIDRLGGLDINFPIESEIFETLQAAGGGDPANEAPTLLGFEDLGVVESGVFVGGNTLNPGVPVATGRVLTADAEGDALDYGFVAPDGSLVTSLSTPYGTITMGPDGTYTYVLNNDAANNLANGENRAEGFLVFVRDAAGNITLAPGPLVVNIVGTNDMPTLSLTLPEIALDEDALAADGGNATVTGMAEGADVDNGAVLRYDFGTDADGNPVTSLNDEYGTLTIDPVTGQYTYTLNGSSDAVQGLNGDDTVTQNVTIRVVDEHGAYSEQTLTVTIQGRNDAPVITSVSRLEVVEAGVRDVAGDANAVFEGTPVDLTGKISASDADSRDGADRPLSYFLEAREGETLTTSVNEAGQTIHTLTTPYGTLTLNTATGEYGFTLNNGSDTVQSLSEDEYRELGFTVGVRDEQGATGTAGIVVGITGTNDRPELTVSDAKLDIAEDAQSVGGTFTVADADSDGTTQTLSLGAGTGTSGVETPAEGPGQPASFTTDYGTFRIDPSTGKYTFTLNNDSDAVNRLGAGQTHTETFTITTTDAHGATSEQTVTVTITGTNDAPVITPKPGQILGVTEAGVVDGGNEATAGKPVSDANQVDASDIDNGDGLHFYFKGEDGAESTTMYVVRDGDGFRLVAGEPGDNASYLGVLNVTATGSYTFTLNNANAEVNGLASGATLDIPDLKVFVKDDAGAESSSTQDFTVRITGTNDAPELTVSDAKLDIVEKVDSVEGSFKIADADSDGATQTLSVRGEGDTTGTGDNPGVPGQPASFTTDYGTFTVNPETGKYVFTLNNDSLDVQKLRAGETHTETFTITTTDAHGATSEQTVTVTITGTNDLPVLKPNPDQMLTVTESGVIDGTNTETAGQQFDSRSASATDVEGEALTYFFIAPDGSHVRELYIIEDPSSPLGYHFSTERSWADQNHLGTIMLDPATGKYGFHLNNMNATINGMVPGDTMVLDGFTMYVKDASGGISETVQEYGVTIKGTNDRPDLKIEGSGKHELTEDSGNYTVEGSFKIVDADRDGDIQTLSIGAGKDTSGTAANPGEPGQTASFTTEYGTLKVNPDGTYSFELNNAGKAVQALGAGKSHTETFTITTTDAHGATDTETITIKIEGTNDKPVLTPSTKTMFDMVESGVLEQNGDPNAAYAGIQWQDGTARGSDVDAGDKLTFFLIAPDGSHVQQLYVIEDPNSPSGYHLSTTYSWQAQNHLGTLMIDPVTGKYGFHLNNNNATINSMTPDSPPLVLEGFEMYVKDQHGSIADQHQDYGVTIKGSNDRPTLVFTSGNGKHEVVDATQIGKATEADHFEKMANGDLRAADVDAGDTKTFTITCGGKSYTVTPEQVANGEGLTIDTPYGKFVFTFGTDGKVSYEYQVNNGYDGKIHGLPEGGSANEGFTIKVTDKWGANSEQKVDIILNGDNDAPWIHPDQTGSWKTTVTEDNGLDLSAGDKGFERTVSTSGTLQASDAEGDTLSFSLATGEGDSAQLRTLPHIVTDANGVEHEIGYITLKPDGSYTYTLFNDNEYVQKMGANTAIEAKFWVRVSDGHGGVTYKELTVTVKGANDSPQVSDGSSTVQEDGGLVHPGDNPNLTVNGKVNVTDIDSNEADAGNTRFVLSGENVTSVTIDGVECTQKVGLYGTLTLWPDGSYTYTLSDTANDGMQGTHKDELFARESFGFEVTTGLGQSSDASQSTASGKINIDITGTNDAPVIDTSVDGSAEIHDPGSAIATVTGRVEATDIDVIRGENGEVIHKDTLSFRFMNKYDDSDNPAGGRFGDTTGQETDPDLAWQAEQTMKGEFGSITLHPDGTYSYTLNVFSPNVKDWPAGHLFNETFRVTVTDEHGATHTVDLKLEIPMPDLKPDPGQGGDEHVYIKDVDASAAVSMKEDVATNGKFVSSGQVTVDYGCDHEASGQHHEVPTYFAFRLPNGEYTQTVSDKYGSLTIDPITGKYTYTLNNDSRYVQELPEGHTINLPGFEVALLDGNGNPLRFENGDPATVTIGGSLTGTNDAPIIDSVGNLVVTDGNEAAAKGEVKAHDIDKADTNNDGVIDHADGQQPLTTTYTYNGVPIGLGESVPMKYGTFTLNADGTYSYKLHAGNETVLALGEGQSLRDEGLVVTVSDGTASVDSPVNVTINGKNDAPTLSFADAEGKVSNGDLVFTEDSGEAVIGGKAVGHDVDAGDTLSYSMELVGGGKSSYILTAKYGTMVLDPVTGEYKYLLNNERSSVQELGSGDSATETFKITVTDALGKSHTETITITINGTDDRAEVTHTQKITSVTENDAEIGKPIELGNVVVKDIDVNDYQTLSLKGGEDGEINWKQDGSVDMAGRYGTLILNADGTYSYTLTSHELGPDVTYRESFTIVVKEYNSKGDFIGETEHTVTVDLKGTNDAPVITGGTDPVQLDAGDAGALSFTGMVTATDVDVLGHDASGQPIHQDLSFSFTYDGHVVTPGTEIDVKYGTLIVHEDGSYTYTINPELDAVKALGEGQVAEDNGLSVSVSDSLLSTSQDITISVTGQNDAPEVHAITSEPVPTEDGTLLFSGHVTATDPDGDAVSYEITDGGHYGTLSIDEHGEFTYQIDNPPVDDASGEVPGIFTESITVDVTDSHGETTSVTFEAVFGVDQDSAVSYEPSGDTGTWYSPEPVTPADQLDQLANSLSQTDHTA